MIVKPCITTIRYRVFRHLLSPSLSPPIITTISMSKTRSFTTMVVAGTMIGGLHGHY